MTTLRTRRARRGPSGRWHTMVALGVAACGAALQAQSAPAPIGLKPGEVAPRAGEARQQTAQTSAPRRVLTLDEALALAEKTSEQLTVAEAGVTRAASNERGVRSEWFPQVSAFASYDRALASEFEGLFDAAGPGCTPFTLDQQAPLTDRVAEIERALRDCPPTGSFFGGGGTDGGTDADEGADGDGDEAALPFGRANTYRVNLTVSQNVYTGGRLSAQQASARLGRANAALNVTTTRAQVALDVAEAYFEAVLSDRLVAIAEAVLAQAESTVEQVSRQREAGRLAEFDLLRAQVTRDTQRPEVIRQRNTRDLAYLRLKQLLEIPLETPLQLVSDLEEAVLPPPAQRFAAEIAAAEAAPITAARTAVTQVANEVQQREAAVRIARAQRMPSVSISSSWGPVAYAGLPTLGDFRTNWTVGASAQVPLFTGGRIKAQETAARADLLETQARLRLTRELATLDEASSRLELANARAAWEATAGTIQQAVRAHEIAELRYREGLSTQLELSDARLLLQQAQANRALAARAVQIARVRLALLPSLPLATGAPTPQLQQTVQQPTAQPPATGATGQGTTGAAPRGATVGTAGRTGS